MKVQQDRASFWAVTYDGTGTNFAIFSRVAAVIRLCLFDLDHRNADPGGGQESLCLALLYASRASVQRCGCTGPSTAQGALSSLLRAHLPAADEPDYAVEASTTSRTKLRDGETRLKPSLDHRGQQTYGLPWRVSPVGPLALD
ncbi:MAG: hypothetical protein JWN19_3329 [Arthrobacter sp.]|nr:hypothetical protein [Arthrobacter sp.]